MSLDKKTFKVTVKTENGHRDHTIIAHRMELDSHWLTFNDQHGPTHSAFPANRVISVVRVNEEAEENEDRS